MRALRRLLQVAALVGTLIVGIVALALIVSQTPWFKDWIRRYIVREANQYLHGDLSIGRIGGNLLFGVQVSDVAVSDISGQQVVAVRNVEVDYSIFTILRQGAVIDGIRLDEPVVRLERDAEGWNVGRLVREQEREADREGPGRSITLESIRIAGGTVVIEDHVGADGYRLPERIDGLTLDASFAYEPVRYTVAIDRAALRTTAPQLSLQELTGTVAVRDDTVFIDRLSISTGESSLTVDGTVQQYLSEPVLHLSTTGRVSLPEIGRVVPAAEGYPLRPQFTVEASGPAERLDLKLDVRSEAGNVRGQVTADVQAPAFGARGTLDLERLNLAPILRDPEQRSNITGQADLDLRVSAEPETVPVTDRMAGSFSFTGPTVMAAGYQAQDVAVTGTLKGGRLNIDGRAAAYGGTATARGFIGLPAEGRRLAFDLRGQADGVDLRGLPEATNAPNLETNLSVAEYHVRGQGPVIAGSAVLNPSSVEGGTLAQGTTAEFRSGPEGVSYAARGSITGLNLQRVGRALEIDALAQPAYDSQVNADFQLTGAMPPAANVPRGESAAAVMTLDASGTLRDSTIMGGRLPQLAFEARLERGALNLHADGSFEGFDPATLAGRKEVAGTVSGTLNVRADVADITGPIGPESITAAGQVVLAESEIGGLNVRSAEIDGRYAGQVADLERLQVAGPDLSVEASGQVALDRTSDSNLTYRIEAVNLEELARLAGQDGVSGSAILEGKVTGNAAALRTSGTLDGSNLGYQENTVLDLASTYDVTIPELDAGRIQVEAETTANFVQAGGLQLNSVEAKTTYAGKELAFTTEIREETRELDATGRVILHPDHQEVHLPNLAVRTEGVAWVTAPGTEAAIQYGQDRIQIENLRLVSGEQALDVSGVVALKGEDPEGDLTVSARNVDLQQLEAMLLMDRGLAGTLSADATLTGTLDAPAVDGRVEIVNGAFENYRYQGLTAEVDYAANRIELDATLQQSPTEFITATGSVPVSLFRPSPAGHVEPTEADRVDLQIRSSDINLGFVQGVTDYVTNVAGTLVADIRVTGSGQDPHVEGFVDIKGGAFGVPLGGVSYTGLDTRLELAEDVVRIREFTILDENGAPLRVAGELAVHARQVGAVNISINSKNFEVLDNELGDVGIDSSLTITGELRRPRVQGSIRLATARLEVDRILELTYDPYAVEELPPVLSAERAVEDAGGAGDAARTALRRVEAEGVRPEREAVDEAAVPGGALEPVELDLRLVIPDNLILRGRNIRPGGPTGASIGDMNITVGGDLQLVKPAGGAFLLLGNVQTIRGFYEFQGRRFTLERGGTIRFLGEPRPNPLLDITAIREIPNTGVTAQIRIQGTADAPQLALSSKPPLDESDILALIVFNRPVNELGTGERASLAATAGGIATGFLAAPLGESIGRALDLDLFEITTSTEEGELGAGVTLGQQFGERAFVRVRQQFGERTATEFLLEYQLADFLRVQTTAAPETTGTANRIGQRRIERAGIDLVFFFSY